MHWISSRAFEGSEAAQQALQKVHEYWEQDPGSDTNKNTRCCIEYACQWMAELSNTGLPYMGKKWILSIRRSFWIQGPVAGCFVIDAYPATIGKITDIVLRIPAI